VRTELTVKRVQAAKPALPGKRERLWDALVPGLALLVTDRGHKSFVVVRRVNGKVIVTTLGGYPALTLEQARSRARAAIEDMARGRDPRQQAKVTATALRAESFAGAVESYIQREAMPNRRPRTAQEIARVLRKSFVPAWSSLSLDQITPRQVLDVLDEIVDAGAPMQANRAYSILRRFFRWCVERHLVATNPAAAVRRPSKEVSRDRVLSDSELREIWTQAGALGWPFGPYIKTLALTGQRRAEVGGMTWAEINLAAREWRIPAQRSKNGREHIVQISSALARLLHDVPRFSNDGPVFTATGSTAVAGFSSGKARLDALLVGKVAPWTFHDLRRSAATGMGMLGVLPHVIEFILNHSSGFRSGVAAVYQRQSYLAERRDALERWGAHVEGLVLPPRADVIPIRRSKK
jgi:integrase